jgi:hypothetical protein
MICGDSSTAEQLAFQLDDGGAIPTSPLHVRNFIVATSSRNEIKRFVELHHYSQSVNGIKSDFCFKMISKDGYIWGAAIYGQLAMANQWKRFADSSKKVIELRRFCCVDEAPTNSESFFIGQTLRWLRKNTEIEVVVSYADAEQNHEGVIYRASNWQYLDFRKGAPVIVWNGKRYHDKSLRTKYKGRLKPFAQNLKTALETGDAKYIPTKGKHTFIYYLKNNKQRTNKK